MKTFIFYASFLYFPFILLAAIYLRRTTGLIRWITIGCVMATSVLAYARFVEPRLLRVVEADIQLAGTQEEAGDEVRFLLFSDTHFGMFHNALPMKRITERARTLDFDAVLIAGDLVYHLPEDPIEQVFNRLNEFGKPVYIVFGNHDVGFPGPDLGLPLTGYIQSLDNVKLLQNRTEVFTVKGRDIWITGTSDLWQNRIEYPTENPPDGTPRIILTHNPDVAMHVPANVNYDILFAGHTHGGQIRIPGMYQSAIPSRYGFDRGLYQLGNDDRSGSPHIYITSGTGMVGLPMRFLIPPQLDLVTIHLPPAS